jgi:hypothetical protein
MTYTHKPSASSPSRALVAAFAKVGKTMGSKDRMKPCT